MLRGGLSEADGRFLMRSVELGRKGWGRVHPNPMVGAVVAMGDRMLGEGYHRVLGGAHAEVAALAAAGDARNATLYTSLEPCRHTGRTPPCTTRIREAGVARVVFWAADPGPVAGGGGKWLRERGLRVDGPFGERGEWSVENPFFFHAPARPRPWLALKLATSLDGRIAPRGGRRRWLTGKESRTEVHRLRAGFDAIMVGRGTWEADDPQLTVRGSVEPRVPPIPVLLDRSGRAPARLRALSGAGGARAIVATSSEAATELRRRLAHTADILAVPTAESGLDLCALLNRLHERGVKSLLCEGGGAVGGSLLADGLVDRIYLFVAPVLIGDDGVPAFPAGLAGDATGAFPRTGGWQARIDPVRFGNDTLMVLDRRV